MRMTSLFFIRGSEEEHVAIMILQWGEKKTKKEYPGFPI
jgi:hypothetical protein